jgi:hypothetical protein
MSKPVLKKMADLSDEDLAKLIADAWDDYVGDCTVFMSAVGALAFGRHVGWQGVRVCMSAATYRKYEKILGVRLRDVLPARTKDSAVIRGIRMSDAIGKFWQALSGGMIPAGEGKMAEPAT